MIAFEIDRAAHRAGIPRITRGVRILAVVMALGAGGAPLAAQEIGLGLHVGTLGLGGDVAVSVGRDVALRASLSAFPFDVDVEDDSVEFSLDLPSPQLLLLVDYYPTGQFRLSAGLRLGPGDYDGVARPTEPVEIGDRTYPPDQVGTLRATVSTRSVSPYIGIGYGRPGRSRVGFLFDLGLAFHGTPRLSAEAEGPIASDPTFQDDLDAEVEDVQDDLDSVVAYPVLALGISVRLTR